jgi:hypothetical protein
MPGGRARGGGSDSAGSPTGPREVGDDMWVPQVSDSGAEAESGCGGWRTGWAERASGLGGCLRDRRRMLGWAAAQATAAGLLRPAGLEGWMGRWFRNRGLGIKGFGFFEKDSTQMEFKL